MPLERHATVIDSFSNAPEQIREVVDTYGYWLEDIGNCPLYFNEEIGELEKTSSGYIPDEWRIVMDKYMNDYEYGIVFRHEYGHYIDDMIGNYSETHEYNQAFKMDKKIFNNATDEGNANIDDMLRDLSENISVFESRYVSDILSAITENDTKIIKYYDKNEVEFFWHRWEKYWFPFKHMKNETFANLFAIYTENNSDIVAFAEKWFPNLTEQFKISINKSIELNGVDKSMTEINEYYGDDGAYRKLDNLTENEWAKCLAKYYMKYQEIFGYIPDESDYSCTREVYAEALLKALEEKKEISEYLKM